MKFALRIESSLFNPLTKQEDDPPVKQPEIIPPKDPPRRKSDPETPPVKDPQPVPQSPPDIPYPSQPITPLRPGV